MLGINFSCVLTYPEATCDVGISPGSTLMEHQPKYMQVENQEYWGKLGVGKLTEKNDDD